MFVHFKKYQFIRNCEQKSDDLSTEMLFAYGNLENVGIFLAHGRNHNKSTVFTICIRTDRPEQTV